MVVDRKTFRVIIVGGGIAGLTLANSLQRANIDYLLLEACDEIAPPAGASIAVGAHGARILDQIGTLDEVLDVSTPSDFFESYKDGKLFDRNDFLKLNHAR
jgi:2-polyprenyl-6-methoxyphenol hydroxylase-like FAD-dependent oxidoreductase